MTAELMYDGEETQMPWLALFGLLVAVGAHVAHAAAIRRARRRHRTMLGDVEPLDSPGDHPHPTTEKKSGLVSVCSALSAVRR